MFLTTVLILALFLVVALLIAIIIWLLVSQGAKAKAAEQPHPTVEVEALKQGELELIGEGEPVYARIPGRSLIRSNASSGLFWPQ